MSLTSVPALQALISQRIAEHRHLPEIEYIPLTQICGRVLAQDIQAQRAIPPVNVSAMDGYALPRAGQINSQWRVIGESAAGHPFTEIVPDDGCIRIMTGAAIPPTACSIIIQENVTLDNDRITLNQAAHQGDNIRYAGEEIAIGQIILKKGHILRTADVLLLATLGIAEVAVYRKIKIAILSTGDELCELGQTPPSIDSIYDSNRPMLIAHLQHFPIEIINTKKIIDNFETVLNSLNEASQNADIIITSGGVSVGDYDYVRKAVAQLGTIHHYKVAMKPGKPFVFGQISSAWYFGLGGNPLSGYVGFDVFLKTALWQLCGAEDIPQPLQFKAILTQDIKKSKGRMDIQRALIHQQEDGTWFAKPCGKQDSHRIYGLSRANAYLLLPEETTELKSGSCVTVQPFSEAFL